MPNAIKLHAWPTPNAYKISIMLAECGLPYDVVPVDITKGDQHKDEFLKLNPNGKMPVLEDEDGPNGAPITIFESGAILTYLAEKTGRFLPGIGPDRYKVTQWLMWQMGGFGPMLGQAHHFRIYAPERVEYGINRYTKEANRLYGVLETALSQNPYIAGPDYSIADMAVYPWCLSYDKQGVDLEDKPDVRRWMDDLAGRKAVQKGLKLLEDEKRDVTKNPLSEEERQKLFG